MPRYKFFYRWEECGQGKTVIEAPSLDVAKEKFESEQYSHEHEELDEAEDTIKAILNLDSGDWEYSEIGPAAEVIEEKVEGIEHPFDEDGLENVSLNDPFQWEVLPAVETLPPGSVPAILRAIRDHIRLVKDEWGAQTLALFASKFGLERFLAWYFKLQTLSPTMPVKEGE